jgi:hypothetical protein
MIPQESNHRYNHRKSWLLCLLILVLGIIGINRLRCDLRLVRFVADVIRASK